MQRPNIQINSNFDMNAEFTPNHAGFVPNTKKGRKPQRPAKLPVALTHYNQAVVNFIFVLIFLTNLLINVDHGSLPAATLNIKSDLNIDNVKLGVLGSLVYLGLTFGTTYVR